MKRHEARELFIFSVYQHLLLKEPLVTMIDKNFVEDIVDPYIKTLESLLLTNEEEYKNRVEPLLNKWSFDRLAYLDQAILLTALAELDEGSNDKAVILDEAIKFAKLYCEEDSYRYINGVLDRI